MSDSLNLSKLMESIKTGGNDLNDEFEVEKDETIKKGSGYNKPENDDECEDECKEEDEETSISQKNKQRKLNTNMSNKSVFDSLYKKVLKENFGPEQDDDIDALGLDDATPDSEMDDDFGGEDEGDSITVTLDKATAQALIDVLQGALGEDEGDDLGEDDDLGGEDDLGGDELDFGGEDEDNEDEDEDEDPSFEEDEETQGTKPAKDKKGAYQGAKKSPQVKSALKPKGKKKANTKVTDGTETGANAKETYNDGKQNKVKGFPGVGDFFK